MSTIYLEKYQTPFNPWQGWSICRVSLCIMQTLNVQINFYGLLIVDGATHVCAEICPVTIWAGSSLLLWEICLLWPHCEYFDLVSLFTFDLLYLFNDANFVVGRHLQNNLLSGTLDALQDLPLKDLYCSQPYIIFRRNINFLCFKIWESCSVFINL